MYSDIEFKTKYLKYKKKYIELKNKIDNTFKGGNGDENEKEESGFEDLVSYNLPEESIKCKQLQKSLEEKLETTSLNNKQINYDINLNLELDPKLIYGQYMSVWEHDSFKRNYIPIPGFSDNLKVDYNPQLTALADIIPLISNSNKYLFEYIIQRHNNNTWLYHINSYTVKNFIYSSLFPNNVSVACIFYQDDDDLNKHSNDNDICDDILRTREAFLDKDIRFIPLVYNIKLKQSILLPGVTDHAVSVIIDKLNNKIYYLDVLCYPLDILSIDKLKQKLKQIFRFDIDSFSIIDITNGQVPIQPNQYTFTLSQLINPTTNLPTYQMCVIYSHYLNCLLINNMNKLLLSPLEHSNPDFSAMWKHITSLITDNQLSGFVLLILMIKNKTQFGIDQYNDMVDLFKRNPKHSQNIGKCTSDCAIRDDNKCSCICENNDCYLPRKMTGLDYRLFETNDSNVARCHESRCKIEKLLP